MSLALRSSLAAIAVLSAACGPSPTPRPPDEPKPATSSSTAPPAALPTAAAAGTPNASEKTLFVRESLADCQGEGPMKCLQVREKESDEWTFFYDRIEGFEHQEGYRYELRVEVTPRSNAPADASSLRYRLVKVVAKEQVTSSAP
jgi:hypothetical protein